MSNNLKQNKIEIISTSDTLGNTFLIESRRHFVDDPWTETGSMRCSLRLFTKNFCSNIFDLTKSPNFNLINLPNHNRSAFNWNFDSSFANKKMSFFQFAFQLLNAFFTNFFLNSKLFCCSMDKAMVLSFWGLEFDSQ